MDDLPIIGVGIVGIVVLCGFLVYVMVIAPKKPDQKHEMDKK